MFEILWTKINNPKDWEPIHRLSVCVCVGGGGVSD